ncbi:MAG: hypothetical protein ACRC6B_07045 [Fusobacteriaceae bacterium]
MKISTIRKNVKAYFGANDGEDEMVMFLMGLQGYDANCVVVEFNANSELIEAFDIEAFILMFGLEQVDSHEDNALHFVIPGTKQSTYSYIKEGAVL